MVLKPDGGEIYVSNFDADTVSVINTSTNELNGSFAVGKNPIRGVISRDAQRLYIANFGSNSISVLEPADTSGVGFNSSGFPSGLSLSDSGRPLFARSQFGFQRCLCH